MDVLTTTTDTLFRKPKRSDAPGMYELVKRCPPLELNSCYAYLILCEHFADTCVVAESQGRIVGCVTAYVPPNTPDTLFVWQVAVDTDARGLGIGSAMLRHLIARDGSQTRRFLETTVAPSNEASARMFQSFAESMGAPTERRVLFCSEDFDSPQHEDEIVVRIGPWNHHNPETLRASRTEQKETTCAHQS